MTEIETIVAIANIATPLLLLILTSLGWFIRNRIEQLREIEEKLREDRIQIYNQILEPYIILLTKDEAFENDRKYKGKSKEEFARSKMLSLEYREVAFKLTLLGSDDVVKAYNMLMQFFYRSESNSHELMHILGNFLLEIRRNMGNKHTKLDNLNMLEWLITDIEKYR